MPRLHQAGETDRRRQPRELWLGDFSRSQKDALAPERRADTRYGRLTTSEELRRQADQRRERRTDPAEAAAYPSRCTGRLDVRPPCTRHQLEAVAAVAACALHGDDDGLDLRQRRRDASRRAVGQEREGLVRRGTVPAAYTQPRGLLAHVAATGPKTATAARMPWTLREFGLSPRLSANVLLAGELRRPSKLHPSREALVGEARRNPTPLLGRGMRPRRQSSPW